MALEGGKEKKNGAKKTQRVRMVRRSCHSKGKAFHSREKVHFPRKKGPSFLSEAIGGRNSVVLLRFYRRYKKEKLWAKGQADSERGYDSDSPNLASS